MARKKDDMNMAAAFDLVGGAVDQEEQSTAEDSEKRAGTSTLVSFRIDDAILRRFRGFSIFSGGTQIEAIERIITAYLDGETIDPEEKAAFDAFMTVYRGKKHTRR